MLFYTSVRKSALHKLIKVYQDYCKTCYEGSMTISDHFEAMLPRQHNNYCSRVCLFLTISILQCMFNITSLTVDWC